MMRVRRPVMHYNTSRMRQIEIETEQSRELCKRKDDAAVPPAPDAYGGFHMLPPRCRARLGR